MSAGGGHVIRNNLFFGPGRTPVSGKPGDSAISDNLVDKAPLFLDAGRFDFRLRKDSPAIDSGEAHDAVSTDLEGTPRPQGKARDAIRNAGGGVLFFPRGTYRITRSIKLPRFATLRGARTDQTYLVWPDTPKPLPALVRGANSFALEKITLYCANPVDIIVGDTGDRPGAGNVSLREVRVRADLFRRAPAPAGVWSKEDAAKRFEAMPYYGPDTLKLGGSNVQITDGDFYGSGNALLLSRARGALVARNKFTNGRQGFCSLGGSGGVIFEENVVQGGDLMSHGSGINCLDGSVSSRNIYYARNTHRDIWGDDREGMTTDGPRGAYVGRITEVKGTLITLAGEPHWGNRNGAGAGVFLLTGRGTGQYRRIASHEGKQVRLEQAFAVAPEATTLAAITPRAHDTVTVTIQAHPHAVMKNHAHTVPHHARLALTGPGGSTTPIQLHVVQTAWQSVDIHSDFVACADLDIPNRVGGPTAAFALGLPGGALGLTVEEESKAGRAVFFVQVTDFNIVAGAPRSEGLIKCRADASAACLRTAKSQPGVKLLGGSFVLPVLEDAAVEVAEILRFQSHLLSGAHHGWGLVIFDELL